jgi:hypothetical protein
MDEPVRRSLQGESSCISDITAESDLIGHHPVSPSRILNQTGLAFQFIALWLVTPDIIGEERMRKAGVKLAKVADRLQKPIASFSGNCLFLGCLFIGLAVISGSGFGVIIVASDWNPLTVLKIIGAIAAAIIGVPFVLLILSLPIAALSWLARKTVNSSKSFLAAGAYCFTIGFCLLFSPTFFGP